MIEQRKPTPSSALTSFVVASRYLPVYIALLVLVIVASIWAPATLGRVAVRAIAPYGAVLGIVALGQMLVVMTGGFDLRLPGTMSLGVVIMVGVRVNLNQILVYVVAAVFYALAGVALAGLLRTPGVAVGRLYLLGPIAAVVIGGASLTGGLASPLSTFVAAIFLTGLNQMLRTMGLPTSLQFVVFGLVIIGGMLVSGDRIIRGVEQVLRERRRPDASQPPAVHRSD